MPLEKGSLIFADYTAKVKDTGEVVKTTRESDAKKLNVFDATKKYGPELVAVGEGWLISGLDDAVKEMDVGQRKEVELAPEKAFGRRDPTQTRMMPLRKFGDRADDLTVGDAIEVDNRVGIVRFIGSGRAQIDFNHRLAGKSILYDFEVVKKVEADPDKVRALVDWRFAGEASKVNIDLEDGTLKIEIPEDLFLLEGLQIIKRGISADVFKYVPSVSELTFVEKFVNRSAQPKKPEEPKAEAAPKPRRRKQTAEAKAT